jgi:hypothetical protein
MLSSPPDQVYTTNRELAQAWTSPAACSGCHFIVNPPGYVLEVYDAVGGRQSVDPLGGAIDGTAEVTLAPGVTRTITSPLELMTEIAQRTEVRRLFAERFVSYSSKRAPNPNDACLVDRLTERLGEPTYRIRDALVDLAPVLALGQAAPQP